MEKYLSNYIGIVIQNNDPEMRGRVKVFVPNVSSNIYANWNEDDTNKIFNFIDNPDIQKILNELRATLPWAEYAGPIFGGCATGRYNSTLKKGTVSDSNAFEDNELIEGYRPLVMYNNELSYPDAFSATGKVGNNQVNPYAYQYIPSNYSNLARGMFSIPNVGAHVWVWFMDGDTNYPVYFASAYGAEDIKRIYTMSQKTGLEGKDATSLDYPGAFENKNTGKLTTDSKTFRAKHVLNTNKNSLEFIDTDGLEKIKMTHYSGSFMEMNNDATVKLTTGNDQEMILGDVFTTIWKNQNEYVGGARDLIIQGDSYEKIGTLNALSVNKIFDLYKNIHRLKLLFDVKRTASREQGEAFKENVTSDLQLQDGAFAFCPVCQGLSYVQELWNMSPMLFRLCLFIPLPHPGFQGLDIFVPGLPPFLEINGKPGYVYGASCPHCNRKNYTYALKDHIGFSASTENGFWSLEEKKQVYGDLGDMYKSSTPSILDLQDTLGDGGDKIVNIARNHITNVGLVMNDSLSYRVDSRGKLQTVRLFLAPEKTITLQDATPHVEHVDVDSLPGGDYIITAGNKLKMLVGANGINIKTFGPIEMYGSIANITAEQMNIMTKHDLFIDGGESLSLRSRNISLNPFAHNPVMIEGGLHVTRNMMVAGGGYIEGELGVQHITAPEQWYQTEPGGCLTMLLDTLPPIPTPGVVSHIHPIILQLPDHKHWYKNIPMTLTKCKEEARDAMIKLGINNSTAISATEIEYPNQFGNILGLEDMMGPLEDGGVDAEAAEMMFDTIGQAIDVSPLADIYSDIKTDLNKISEGMKANYEAYQTAVNNALSEVSKAYSGTLKP